MDEHAAEQPSPSCSVRNGGFFPRPPQQSRPFQTPQFPISESPYKQNKLTKHGCSVATSAKRRLVSAESRNPAATTTTTAAATAAVFTAAEATVTAAASNAPKSGAKRDGFIEPDAKSPGGAAIASIFAASASAAGRKSRRGERPGFQKFIILLKNPGFLIWTLQILVGKIIGGSIGTPAEKNGSFC